MAAGADPEVINSRGTSAIHVAAAKGNAEIMRLFDKVEIDGAEIDLGIEDEEGFTPLHYAAAHNSSECAQLLITAGCLADQQADPLEATSFIIAASKGHMEVLRVLETALKADEVSEMQTDCYDYEGRMAIHAAAYSKNPAQLEVMKYLYEVCDVPFGTDEYERDAGHIAAARNNVEAMKRIVEEGLDLYDAGPADNMQDNQGKNWVHYAAVLNNNGILKAILETRDWLLRKLMDFQDDYGLTPLHAATICGSHLVIDLLIDEGAEMDTQDNCGWRAHDWAKALKDIFSYICRSKNSKAARQLQPYKTLKIWKGFILSLVWVSKPRRYKFTMASTQHKDSIIIWLVMNQQEQQHSFSHARHHTFILLIYKHKQKTTTTSILKS